SDPEEEQRAVEQRSGDRPCRRSRENEVDSRRRCYHLGSDSRRYRVRLDAQSVWDATPRCSGQTLRLFHRSGEGHSRETARPQNSRRAAGSRWKATDENDVPPPRWSGSAWRKRSEHVPFPIALVGLCSSALICVNRRLIPVPPMCHFLTQ